MEMQSCSRKRRNWQIREGAPVWCRVVALACFQLREEVRQHSGERCQDDEECREGMSLDIPEHKATRPTHMFWEENIRSLLRVHREETRCFGLWTKVALVKKTRAPFVCMHSQPKHRVSSLCTPRRDLMFSSNAKETRQSETKMSLLRRHGALRESGSHEKDKRF